LKIVLFCHSLLSDWNHGNAHFLRGLVTELCELGHRVDVFEPRDAWSVQNLVREHGNDPLRRVRQLYPRLDPIRYHPAKVDVAASVRGADLVIVHEWNEPWLVGRLGALRKRGGRFHLLFHDTHHRSASAPGEISRYDLSGYDGVLAFGTVVRDLYLRHGWARRAWTWHEAADVRVFRPRAAARRWDLVWIGNWGDDERTAELHEFLLGPVRALGLKALVHGVRYPPHAVEALRAAGVEYRGWVANFEVPRIFASARVTVHIPRGPYTRLLPGIPTIRPFEALACGIPLISAPWNDCERLFRRGTDHLVARDGAEMERHLRALLSDPALAQRLARCGLATVRERHTCAHRARELVAICSELDGSRSRERATA
jgi:spore maturation protein CgeB